MKIVEIIRSGSVIHCGTKEEATRILGLLHFMGKGWVRSPAYDNESPNLLEHNNCSVFKENTVYNPWSSYGTSIGQVAYGHILNYKHMPVVKSTDIDGCYEYISESDILIPLPLGPGRMYTEHKFEGVTVINEYVLDLSKSCQIKVNTAESRQNIYPHTVIYEIISEESVKYLSYNHGDVFQYDCKQINELVANHYLVRLVDIKRIDEKRQLLNL